MLRVELRQAWMFKVRGPGVRTHRTALVRTVVKPPVLEVIGLKDPLRVSWRPLQVALKESPQRVKRESVYIPFEPESPQRVKRESAQIPFNHAARRQQVRPSFSKVGGRDIRGPAS